MELQNIGSRNNNDAFYRYKMPKLATKIHGRGNGIKTSIVNMVEVAKALSRSPAHVTRFFGCELGAQSSFNDKTNTFIVNGAHETPKLCDLLDRFIEKYVQCYKCGNPETDILLDKMISLKCAACGHLSDVDLLNSNKVMKKFYSQSGSVGCSKKDKRAAKVILKNQSRKNENLEEDDGDDDHIERHADAAPEAAHQRMKEQLTGAATSMTLP
ncbi:probable eukaryotic translation initiation factor 5-1 [Selaginella moellendorffii]|nr:probable eukaryotic translation initiation factor 5-1 [Selaginella moellendorffii]|eukprot:XP_002965983.2 probable eukaryotic translation initiation factor 5-1 [Selaginella moellendorffii]